MEILFQSGYSDFCIERRIANIYLLVNITSQLTDIFENAFL
jgi:hypothetical protein